MESDVVADLGLQDPVAAAFWDKSIVKHLHLEFVRGGNVTGLLHERLDRAHAAQQTHRMFSDWPPCPACAMTSTSPHRFGRHRPSSHRPRRPTRSPGSGF